MIFLRFCCTIFSRREGTFMAVSWIKVEVILPDKPEVVAMAAELKMKDIDTVVGKLIRLWSWADQQTVTGNGMLVSGAYIDRLVFYKGFTKALISVGWMCGEDGSQKFVNFERHNGETAKARAESARRRELAAKAFSGLERPLSEVEKIAVAEYLSHEPELGGKFDYPTDRELFFSIMQEVIQKAMAWFRRAGRTSPAEKEEAKRRNKLLKIKNDEGMARRWARQFRYSPEELIAEIEMLRAQAGVPARNDAEKERIMKGDYEL